MAGVDVDVEREAICVLATSKLGRRSTLARTAPVPGILSQASTANVICRVDLRASLRAMKWWAPVE